MKSSKVITAALSGCLAVSLILAPAALAADSSQAVPGTDQAQAAASTDRINEIMQYLEQYNVEGIDQDTLIRGAIDGMVNTLNDPYSQYFDKDEAAAFSHAVDLEYVGIGIRMVYTAKELYIEEVVAGSPAEQAGLKRGDTILKINGVKIQDTKGDELSGTAGTKVSLLVSRKGVLKTFSVKRSEMASTSVTSKMLGQNIAYISIGGFTQNADEEFTAALDKMRAGGMKSLVLDLRDNTGGYMDSAYNIASQFMDKGIMMYTSDQSGALTPVTITNGSKIGVPVVVLTNEYTASASEALTGALHDNKLATVVGTRSFGKARIQSLIPVSDGAELKLTTQKYLTPSKEDFNHIGLSPDIEVQGKTAQLITALQIAGMNRITASGDNHILDVNGSPFAGNVGLIKQGNTIYASSRVLAALLESEVSWDAKNKKVLVTNGTGKVSGFALASKEALSQNNETFIDVKAFQQKFPSLVWSYNAAQNLLKLSVK
ncbi:S41 family peptidase [Paenibacillus riograndensis]|uniref:Carboxyl-terminal protease n=1 Tax=Paenibacillus riograndensis SBR5 TaxID=1073571 RepID=A0A0E4HDG3_9BACL|nr:S41 family peptidase [Paenibacillus riograndensis]CQR58072.1 carboxyl-terminal protease [Paenibacillus riograndensis SBR5]